MGEIKQEQSYFEKVCLAFQDAAKKAEAIYEYYYKIAEHSICLRFAGESLVPLMTHAFKHLQTQTVSKPDLTLCLWDRELTKTDLPPTNFCRSEYYASKPGLEKTSIYSAWQPDYAILSILSCEENLGFYCIPQAKSLPYFETAAPLRLLFHWWMQERGIQLIHSGCVGKQNKGILFAGKGGSGKSTTTLACLLHGMDYLGDDYVLVSHKDATVYSLYNSGKIHADNIHRLPSLLPLVKNADKLNQEKAIVFLYDFFPAQILYSLPLHAILMPKITGQKATAIKKASATSALMALGPSTIFQMAGAGEKALGALVQLVQKTPVFSLELSTEAAEIAQFLDAFAT
ncbi:MAG: serine kinase [Candidatus Brocadiae bacterium]|nr:serine kinase [Candidatus Brocadiia bacterium]